MKNYIVFGYTNFKYIQLALYWVSYIQKLNLEYRIYCTDQRSYDSLMAKKIKCILIEENNYKDFTDFGLIRFKIMYDLFHTYENVIYSDIDAIWINNPLDKMNKDFDANFSVVTHEGAHPPCIRAEWGLTVCTGWLHLKNTCKGLIKEFIEEYYKYRGNDQSRFNQFIFDRDRYNTFDKNMSINSFTLALHEYNLKVLGLNDSIIHRGDKIVNNCDVIHPLLYRSKTIDEKIEKIKTIMKDNSAL